MATTVKNPFSWVEIYVEDMDRAKKFYETVFQIQMSAIPLPDTDMGEFEMVSFPGTEHEGNISGALVKTPSVKPGSGGTLVYFECDDCSVEESRIQNAGGQLLRSKLSIGDYGYCSIAMDTEGNTIGLHSMA